MIFDAIVLVLKTVFEGVLGLLPTMSLPAGLTDSMAGIGTRAAALDGIVPVYVLGVCIAAVIGVKLALLAWGVIVFIYDRFPFKAT